MGSLCVQRSRPAVALFLALILVIAGDAFAQYEPIGRHYEEPIVLIENESEDHPGIMNQAEAIDLNGDGRDDAVYSATSEVDTEGPAQFSVLLANESGSMDLSTENFVDGEIPIADRGYRQIIPADFNGDGKVDLFLESHGGEPDCGGGVFVECWTGGLNSLLLSNDNGTLTNTTAVSLPMHSDFTHGASVADFDRDGDIDIWVHNLPGSPLYNPNFSYLLENNGQGVFTIAADASTEWDIPITGRNGILPEGDLATFWSFAVDAEGDGDFDLGLGWSWGFEENIFLVNDGAGRFEISDQPLPSPRDYVAPHTQHALVHDINGDDLDDVLLHQTNAEHLLPMLQVLISNGDGTFRDESSSRYPEESNHLQLSAFQLHDLDNDGHMDLFSHIDFERVEIRVNDGEGYFRELSENWAQMDWNWLVLDVDGDGGTDFLEVSPFAFVLNKMGLPYGAVMDGTEDDDRLIGGAHDNVYRGLEGNDVLDGGLGDDDLDGGPGNDELIGGKGNDRMIPGSGTDSIKGGPDRDIVEYDFPIGDAEILLGQTTLISRDDNSSNDQIETTEYVLFSDAATPLPTKEQSPITSLNGVAGLWYDPDLDGEGFNVITTPSGTVIFFYGFNANSERLWLISENLANDLAFEQVFDLQMYEAQGGTFAQPAPSSEALSEWGRLKGLFDACGSGRFALHGDDGVKTSYQTRLAGITNADCTTQTLAAPSGLAGLWYDPLLDGEGYNFIITESATVILFYGYATDGERLWLISESMAGAPQIGETTTLQMFVSTDGTFDEPLASSEVLKDWGEFEITLNSCGAAIAKLSGDDGEKISTLEKLAGIDHSTCP